MGEESKSNVEPDHAGLIGSWKHGSFYTEGDEDIGGFWHKK